MLILFGAVLATWLLGSLLHMGTDLMYAFLLMTAVVAVARLPWRQTE